MDGAYRLAVLIGHRPRRAEIVPVLTVQPDARLLGQLALAAASSPVLNATRTALKAACGRRRWCSSLALVIGDAGDLAHRIVGVGGVEDRGAVVVERIPVSSRLTVRCLVIGAAYLKIWRSFGR